MEEERKFDEGFLGENDELNKGDPERSRKANNTCYNPRKS